jgi:hypothetical protein
MKKSLSIALLLIGLSACAVLDPSKMDIPKEPTLWVVSQLDSINHKNGQGFIFYKLSPVNAGGLNVKPVWIMDYSGAFQVGDIVSFRLFTDYSQAR